IHYTIGIEHNFILNESISCCIEKISGFLNYLSHVIPIKYGISSFNFVFMSTKLERRKLTLPNGHNKLLLHSCCAPCSGEVMETLIESGIDFSIFFYNPNIHPVKEYEIRKEENIRFAEKHNIPFIDCDYDTDN